MSPACPRLHVHPKHTRQKQTNQKQGVEVVASWRENRSLALGILDFGLSGSFTASKWRLAGGKNFITTAQNSRHGHTLESLAKYIPAIQLFCCLPFETLSLFLRKDLAMSPGCPGTHHADQSGLDS